MMAQHLRRTGALLVSAALSLASLAPPWPRPPVRPSPRARARPRPSWARPEGEVIKGTKKADVIVARGGHDRIYGLGGNDTICGGPGNDRILGAAGNDLLFGQAGATSSSVGPGVTACSVVPPTTASRVVRATMPACRDQVSGCGSAVSVRRSCRCRCRCRRPRGRRSSRSRASSSSPTRTSMALDGYSTGDVMISKIVDTNSDGVVSKDDTIKMGRYPKNTHPGPGDFADWTETSHVIDEVFYADQTEVLVTTTIGATHGWWADSPDPNEYDEYSEWLMGLSDFEDKKGPDLIDSVEVQADSPSRPVTEIPDVSAEGPDDDWFIDVELRYQVSP